jgi:hypothetical protein
MDGTAALRHVVCSTQVTWFTQEQMNPPWPLEFRTSPCRVLGIALPCSGRWSALL